MNEDKERLKNLGKIINKDFWYLNGYNRKRLLRQYQEILAESQMERLQDIKITDENGEEKQVVVPERFYLSIEYDGEDYLHQFNNYYVQGKKAYQTGEMIFKDREDYYRFTPSGIVECKKTLVREFETTRRIDKMVDVKTGDRLNSWVSKYLTFVFRNNAEKECKEILEHIENERLHKKQTCRKRKITVVQEILLKNGSLIFRTKIYDPDELIYSIPGYKHNNETKTFVKSEKIEKDEYVDFNAVIKAINRELSNEIEDVQEMVVSPTSYLMGDKEKYHKARLLYYEYSGINLNENCFVVNEADSYKQDEGKGAK